MPVNLKDIASIAGMSGLYRIVSPTRNGVIIETLDEKANRQVAQSKHRISLLNEISIYTEDAEVTVPLSDVFDRIRQQYGPELTIDSKAGNSGLFEFIKSLIPDYDRNRVYASDIKKIIAWYNTVSKYVPFEEAAPAEAEAAPTDETASEKKPAKRKKSSE